MNLLRQIACWALLTLAASTGAQHLPQAVICGAVPGPGVEWVRPNRIKVIDDKGALIRTITLMDGIVRNVISLKQSAHVIVSRLESSELWDTASAEMIQRINGCVHGLSDDESVYVAFLPWPEASMEVRRLDSRDLVLKWVHPARYGISSVLFSPDGRYLAVHFSSTHPVPDERWGVKGDIMKAVDCVVLFDLERAMRVEAFGMLYGEALGEFTGDSRNYLRRVSRGGAQVFDLERGDWVRPGS